MVKKMNFDFICVSQKFSNILVVREVQFWMLLPRLWIIKYGKKDEFWFYLCESKVLQYFGSTWGTILDAFAKVMKEKNHTGWYWDHLILSESYSLDLP